MEKIANIRKEYQKSSLDISSIDANPIEQFKIWLEEAVSHSLHEPTAMTLATASKKGVPSSRIVLLKDIINNQFVFFTNYASQKGKVLEENPVCALHFFWPELERQVAIRGTVVKTSMKEADHYFESRPRKSQLSAWVSPQSATIKNRKILEEREKKIEHRYKGKKIPRPQQWGGYAVIPVAIEFWQGRPARLHDRIVYYLQDNEWSYHRLAP